MHIEIDKSMSASRYLPTEKKILLGTENQGVSLAHELGHHFKATAFKDNTCFDLLRREYLAWEWAAQHTISQEGTEAFIRRCLKSYFDVACVPCVKEFVQWLQARENL